MSHGHGRFAHQKALVLDVQLHVLAFGLDPGDRLDLEIADPVAGELGHRQSPGISLGPRLRQRFHSRFAAGNPADDDLDWCDRGELPQCRLEFPAAGDDSHLDLVQAFFFQGFVNRWVGHPVTS